MGQQWLWYSGRAFDYQSQSWAAPTDQGHGVGFVNGAEFVVRRGWTVADEDTSTESGTEIVGLRPDGGNWVCRIDPEWPMRYMAVDRTVLVGQRLVALGRRYNPFGTDTPPKSYVVFSVPLTGYEVRPGDWPAADGDGLRRAPR